MFKWLREKLIKYLVKNLFHPVTADDILGVDIKGNLKVIATFQGRELDPEQIIRLKENAESFEKSLLWRFMRNQIKLESQEIMFRQSKVDNDLYFGKAILFELKVMEELLEKIKNL